MKNKGTCPNYVESILTARAGSSKVSRIAETVDYQRIPAILLFSKKSVVGKQLMLYNTNKGGAAVLYV